MATETKLKGLSLERVKLLVKLMIFKVVSNLFELNSFDIESGCDRLRGQSDKGRRIFVICGKNRGKISFDVL